MIEDLIRISEFLLSLDLVHFALDPTVIDTGYVQSLGPVKGWFVVEKKGDGLLCVAKRWSDGKAQSLFTGSGDVSKLDQKAYVKRRKELERSVRERHFEKKELAWKWWHDWFCGASGEPSDYLVKKGLVQPSNVVTKLNTNDNQRVLVIPMFDEYGDIWNLQQIYSKGEKRYVTGARKKGLFHVLNNGAASAIVYLGEGYATCLSVATIQAAPVWCAFDKNNLEDVLRIMLEKWPADRIVLLADFDGESYQKTGKNPGMLEAQKLAVKYRVRVAVPVELLDCRQNVDFADLDSEERGRRLDDLWMWEDLALSLFKKEEQVVEKGEGVPIELIEEPEVVEVGGVPDVVDSWPEAEPEVEVDHEPDPARFPTKADGFHFNAGDVDKPKWMPHFAEFSEWMTERYFLRSLDGVSYGYDDGWYQVRTKLDLAHEASRLVRRNCGPRVLNSFVENLIIESFTRIHELRTPVGKINLQNGILDVTSGGLSRHTPKYFFQYKLPHKFDPLAECPKWKTFLWRTFEENQELCDLAGEVFGYVLLGGDPWLHKAILLQGEGRNGKGVFLDVMKAMIGRENFSAVPLNKLDRPFSAVQCDGKLANIVSEVSSAAIQSDVFKTAVSGEQVQAAFKGRDEYVFDFTARIVIASNRTPYMGEATTGVHEKFLILPFNHYVQKGERVRNFTRRDLFPEMPGIINWALSGLRRLEERGAFPEVEAVEKHIQEMRKEIDPFYEWWSEQVVIGGDGEVVKLTFKPFYEKYEKWAYGQNLKPLRQLQFSKKCVAEVRKNLTLRVTYPQGLATVTGKIRLK